MPKKVRGIHTMHDPINNILTKLDKVTAKKPTKDGLSQWQAVCPAHDDKSPSLTITEASDGTVLVKCWAGCNANEIVKALGLELKDLFPCTQLTNKPSKLQPSKRAIAHERLIISIAEASLTLSHEDNERYRLALKRLKEVN